MQTRQTHPPHSPHRVPSQPELPEHREKGQEKCLARVDALIMVSTAASPSEAKPPSPNQGEAPAEKPSAPPVNILPSQLARTYSCVHPILLLALCFLRFEGLVADPVKELLRDLPWLALLQIFYAMLCLPPAGSTPSADSTSSDDEKKKAPRSPTGPSVSLRPGKPGYRRKQHSGKSDWPGLWAKLMVWTETQFI